MKNKSPRKFPMDGPPLHLQAARLNPARSATDTVMLRSWVKNNKNARPETLAAYAV